MHHSRPKGMMLLLFFISTSERTLLMTCQHTPGKMTLIINDLSLPNGDRTNLAIHMCAKCGQAFTNDTAILSGLSKKAKVSLSATLNQLPPGEEIFTELC